MAYECSPYRGSEWAVGWGRLLGASKVAETHVVTSEENFAALRRARDEGILPENVLFYTPAPDDKLRRMERKPAIYAYNYKTYHYWQKLAFAQVQELHARENFDLVHQISVCTFREPGYGWKLGVPFVWGPVGGTQNFPTRFLSMLAPKEALKEGLRTAANKITLRKPRVRRAARRASALIAANSTNEKDFRSAFGRDIDLLLETGIHEVMEPNRDRFEARLANDRSGRKPAPLQILWSGELQTRKALPVLLRALSRLKDETPWQLNVVGDGPLRERWAAEAAQLGIADKVHFLGRLSFPEAVKRMHSAELFCFTSLRDTSGNVVLEALAAGVPVMCFDHQGAGDMVSDFSGVKLAVRSPRQAYEDWGGAIRVLAADPRKLYALSRGATVQARRFLWSRNHACVNAMYERLVDEQTELVAFPAIYPSEERFETPIGIVHGSSH